MAKQKTFHGKLIQKLKRDAGRNWTAESIADARAVASRMRPERVGTAPIEFVGEGFIRNLQQEAVFRAADEWFRDETGIGWDEPLVYPGLMAAWDAVPMTVDFDPALVERVLAEVPDFAGVSTANVRQLFPACLMFDARGWGRELYGNGIDALFAYPSYDSDRGYEMLLLLGVNQRRGMNILYESKLLLVGDTLGEMVDASIQERERLRGRCLAGLDSGLHDEIFSPYEDEEAILHLGSQLLGLMLWEGARVDFGERRGVQHRYVHFADEGEIACECQSKRESADDAANASECDETARNARLDEEPSQPSEHEALYGEASNTQVVIAARGSCSSGQNDSPAESDASSSPDALDGSDAPHGEVDSRDGEAGECGIVQPGPDGSIDSASEVYRLRALLAEQEAKCSSLEYHLAQAREAVETANRNAEGLAARAGIIDTMDLPETPAESLSLAERAFPDRLVVLPSARKSAEEFRKGDAAEVWAVLRSIAVVLYPLVFGPGGGSVVHAFQAQTGFELTLREMKHIKQSGKFSRFRTVKYMGRERDMSPHVKGRGSKRGETLRVHFFTDHDNGDRIVIAHCGEHLPTYNTTSL